MALTDPIPFEELQVPELKLSRSDSTAKRVIRLQNWYDWPAFVILNFPAAVGGYAISDDVYPGVPWLAVDTIEISGFDPHNMDSSNPPNCLSGALVTVNYKTMPYTNANDGTNNDNKDSPNTDKESDGPESEKDGQGDGETMLSWDVDIGGQMVTFPGQSLMWFSDQKAPPADVQFGYVETTIEHTVTWHHAPIPPWGAIRRCRGTVNDNTYMTAPVECLLFNGVQGSREFATDGNRTWTLKYKFSEKNNYFADGSQGAGWNHYLRPDKSPVDYDRLVLRTTPPAVGRATYQTQSFINLFVAGGT